MTRKGINTLTGPIILSVVLLALSAALLLVTHNTRAKAVAERVEASRAARQQTDRYRNTSSEEPLIRRTIERFDTLSSRGIIGPEHRLDWADRMRAIRERHHIAELGFELSPQRSLGPLSTSGDFVLNASRMRIRAGLLHEGEFMAIMDELRSPGDAIVAPRQCTLTPSAERAAQAINLRAECTVDWLTVSNANTGTGSKP